MDTKILGIENTGPVTRVWVDASDEQSAREAARDALGVDDPAEVVYHDRTNDYEVIFDR